ncbi:MAG TPA: RNA-binding protein, partial [Dictyoglomaceae bacterium]|nr:RNA-binding protein [Dictyoglomaceae bacterium]
DRNTGRSKGFAFVETSDDLAQKLIDSYNGFEFNGRKIIVSEARPRTERSSAPRYRKF